MAVSPGFPRSLLEGPRSARLAHLGSYTVAHPLLVEAKETPQNNLNKFLQ